MAKKVTTNFLIEIALESERILRRLRGKKNKQKRKSDNTLVTKADKLVNAFIIKKVRAQYPWLSIFGEEESSLTADKRRVLTADPVDGTLQLVLGNPMYTCMLSYMEDGMPVRSVVYDCGSRPKRLYVASEKGAFMNGKPIRVSNKIDLRQRPIIYIDTWPAVIDETGSEIRPAAPYRQLEVAQYLEARGWQIMTYCSGGHAAMAVARGASEAAISASPSLYDLAPIHHFVERAGGTVSDIRGQYALPLTEQSRGLVMSNGLLHPQIIEAIAAVNGYE
jgi:fructose-1,6-bisphosphatase/inositol monophosphatase family enzyme